MSWVDEIKTLESKITLVLDHPASVKQQVKEITLVQKQLRVIKREINAQIQLINQNTAQSRPDSIVSVGLDLFGKRRMAGTVRSITRQAMQREKQEARQPYLDLKNYVDQFILEGDRLKLAAQNYLNSINS
ncbi:hypothetical protein RIF25_12320 [Thermosynechococcaceae cyanobacterium BACA0444]|uniref:Uncharacterized protein n=1 Tax=Pseudocalidococcus azoricus BACA0444 TaxID=2918990 RepID=A0AAE4FV38_9CYAN|nr:hypothetical protein [Pseudocalidococcus azoricus]MDS3861591.1 hypothetical protein [Pseudocalidococcus azoricus BACA0444]